MNRLNRMTVACLHDGIQSAGEMNALQLYSCILRMNLMHGMLDGYLTKTKGSALAFMMPIVNPLEISLMAGLTVYYWIST